MSKNKMQTLIRIDIFLQDIHTENLVRIVDCPPMSSLPEHFFTFYNQKANYKTIHNEEVQE